MNAGLFSLPDGGAMSARRLIGVSGRDTNTPQNAIYAPLVSQVANVAGLAQYAITVTTAATRLRIYSATGRGAVRLMLVECSAGAAQYRIEAYVDGMRIYDRTITNGSGQNQCQALVGFTVATASSMLPDYMPFDSSFEVYVTMAQASQTVRWCYLVEAHQ